MSVSLKLNGEDSNLTIEYEKHFVTSSLSSNGVLAEKRLTDNRYPNFDKKKTKHIINNNQKTKKKLIF